MQGEGEEGVQGEYRGRAGERRRARGCARRTCAPSAGRTRRARPRRRSRARADARRSRAQSQSARQPAPPELRARGTAFSVQRSAFSVQCSVFSARSQGIVCHVRVREERRAAQRTGLEAEHAGVRERHRIGVTASTSVSVCVSALAGGAVRAGARVVCVCVGGAAPGALVLAVAVALVARVGAHGGLEVDEARQDETRRDLKSGLLESGSRDSEAGKRGRGAQANCFRVSESHTSKEYKI